MIATRRRPTTNPDPFHCFPATDSSPSAATAVTPADARSRTNEFVPLSESLKSKLSTASVRYRELFSKGTRSLKEKITARNDSVKELGRGVQRKKSAGIAGIAKLISRRRGGVSSASTAAGTSHSRHEVGRVGDNSVVEVASSD